MFINSGASFLAIPGFFRGIVNAIMKGLYGIYFAVISAIAWILDMLTQLFFIFSGMTPIGTGAYTSDGELLGDDILNYFVQSSSFRNAYLELCLVALGLVIVFTIGKIIKQDYFDRAGPRSKAPIFRNVALSFIAFICVIPVFMFIIQIASSLAMLVMNAIIFKQNN